MAFNFYDYSKPQYSMKQFF